MSISLDFGTDCVSSLRRAGGEIIGRSMPATLALIEDRPATRALLAQADLAHLTGDGELVLYGESALDYAGTFRAIPERLLHEGRVPTDDPPVRELISVIVESMLPQAEQPGQSCGLVLSPAAMSDHESHSFVGRLVQARGYNPLLLTPSLALMLATFSAENFSGIGIYVDAGGCSISLVHRGREIVHVPELRGTDWIDRELAAEGGHYIHDRAGRKYLDLEAIRRRREAPANAGADSAFTGEVSRLSLDILRAALAFFGEQLGREHRGPYALDAPVIYGGAGTRCAGFRETLAAAIDQANLPVPLGSFRAAPADEYLIARGALIHAEIESALARAA